MARHGIFSDRRKLKHLLNEVFSLDFEDRSMQFLDDELSYTDGSFIIEQNYVNANTNANIKNFTKSNTKRNN